MDGGRAARRKAFSADKKVVTAAAMPIYSTCAGLAARSVQPPDSNRLKAYPDRVAPDFRSLSPNACALFCAEALLAADDRRDAAQLPPRARDRARGPRHVPLPLPTRRRPAAHGRPARAATHTR